ncbi:cryptochrome/photolyase family protein [Roseibacillus persicicus]|uniref:cryptochrome/photolyase family protein n=1 Tax=Roseibacillus persicicus TaxID=454148 RepID=UPI00280C8266|nr:deoxyribodipyrimidine photo-lyase [Roseibacillus persicicus]MDQ8190015.1 deoxyribodipyrimidine photo-lyase [Roseibacillus persicicus]
MPESPSFIIHWFRRDLRVSDNSSLLAASQKGEKVVPLYVASDWKKAHAWTGPGRQQFLCECLESLAGNLAKLGGRLIIRSGDPVEAIARLLDEGSVSEVHYNRDPDPHGKKDELRLAEICEARGVACVGHDDVALHTFDQTTKDDGTAYRVYTPYSKRWLKLEKRKPASTPKQLATPDQIASDPLPTLENWQLNLPSHLDLLSGSESAARSRLKDAIAKRLPSYAQNRDHPSVPATSRLSQDLRWGTLSIRKAYAEAHKAHEEARDPDVRASYHTFIKELAWRDFYLHLLEAYPEVLQHEFNADYRGLPWAEPDEKFEAWKEGHTGFPIVDAGMRELRTTGFMHNRVRMIVAMFLTKDLHLDWRLGEQHFAQHLLDGEIASNNGGWQWSAGTGADAAPYFRIQNPWTQSKRFDAKGEYIKRWVPELDAVPAKALHEAPDLVSGHGKSYPQPIVNHAQERDKTLSIFKKHLDTVRGKA